MCRRATAHRRARVSRVSATGKDLDRADQGARQPARPVARVLAGRRVRVHGDPARSRRSPRSYTARGNLVAVITNGTAVLGLGNIGALAGKPVMEGKGCLFKKFAGIDVFDIEIGEIGPRQDRRGRRRAGADVRRHQPRGHQGARVLLHRAQAARADEDPGVPRRPARHGDRRRGGGAQRAQDRRQGHRQGEARLLGRGRRGDRLPRPAGAPRPATARTSTCSTARASSRKGRTGKMDADKARYAQDTSARTLADVIARRGRLPRPVDRRRADAGHGQDDGRQADHPGDGQSRARDPARAREGGAARLPHRHRPLRLSEPGQQLAVLPVHLPRRARLRRDDDQRGDEARRGARARRARAGRALRHRRAGLRRAHARVRSRLPDPARRSTRA